MAYSSYLALSFIYVSLFLGFSSAEDPFVNFNFVVSYITASPLGVPQQVCFLDLYISLCLFLSFVSFVIVLM